MSDKIHWKNLINMTEKQIILSKVEYDQMEQELKDLRAVVESRLLSKIVRPNYAYWGISGSQIQYVTGVEESEAVTELTSEITKLESEIVEYQSRAFRDGEIIQRLNDQIKAMKQKPWYKRIFSI